MMDQRASHTLSLPAGYERWTLSHRDWLALPQSVIDELLLERQAEFGDGRGFVKPAAPKVAKAPPAPPPVLGWQDQWGAEAATGCHRVLLHFDALHSGAFLAERLHRCADTDVGRRLEATVNKLLESGPDRRFARATAARSRLQSLEQEMPHFREPLRLLTNALALAEAAPRPVRIPPMLLLRPPGLGKTYFSQQIAELLDVPHAALSFDQPSAGNALRGTDAHWSNSSTGLLFELLCLGPAANPVILLDELDKAAGDSSTQNINPLQQLHSVLEPVTSRRTSDMSVDVAFDASLVTYIATANTLRGLEPSILSRFEVFVIEPPEPRHAVETARRVVESALERMGLADRLRVHRSCHYLLAHFSPRRMQRTIEKAAASAIAEGRELIVEADLWGELGLASDALTH